MIGIELAKQLRRGRTLIALATVAAIPVIVGAALTLGNGGPEPGEGPPFLTLVTSNGLFLPISSVAATSRFFLLVVAAMFIGEAVGSESSWGTERFVLIRPVSRFRYLFAKLFVGELLVIAAVTAVAAMGTGVGWALFGLAPLQLGGVELSVGQVLLRIGAMVAYASFGLLTIGAISLAVAVGSGSSAASVVTAVGAGIISQILDAIGALGDARRYLPTHYWDSWISLFQPQANIDGMGTGILLGAGYALSIILFSFWLFQRKDITS